MRKRGGVSGPIRCYECGKPSHIKMDCPKLRSKEIKDDKAPTRRTQFKIDPSKKCNYRRAVNKVLSALEEINLSDVDSASDDEDKGKKANEVDFTGMCFMTTSVELNDDDLYSDPDEISGGPRGAKENSSCCTAKVSDASARTHGDQGKRQDTLLTLAKSIQ